MLRQVYTNWLFSLFIIDINKFLTAKFGLFIDQQNCKVNPVRNSWQALSRVSLNVVLGSQQD